VSDMFSA